MWKRRELKKKAREVVKKNYWTAIVVCFLIAILTGEFGTSIVGIWQVDNSTDPDYAINQDDIFATSENKNDKIKEILQKWYNFNNQEIWVNNLEDKSIDLINANINSITKSEKYIYKIWDAIELFKAEKPVMAIGLIMASILAMIYIVFLAEPLLVAERVYFIKARKNPNTKIGAMKEVFKKGNWSNIAIIMLLKNIYNALWFLTIIGGFIKTYEYRMIPYILAENPTMKRKEVFELSKKMMKKNKWRAFILDMSFIWWAILSLLTFGLVNVLYLNPYRIATSVELYEALKENSSN